MSTESAARCFTSLGVAPLIYQYGDKVITPRERHEAWTTLQLLIRHRRDLVRKGAALNCQIRDHLEAAVPRYAACFDKLWESAIPWHLLRHYPTAGRLPEARVASLSPSLRP